MRRPERFWITPKTARIRELCRRIRTPLICLVNAKDSNAVQLATAWLTRNKRRALEELMIQPEDMIINCTLRRTTLFPDGLYVECRATMVSED